MAAKPEHPWFFVIVCAINVTAGLFYNALTVDKFQPSSHWDCIINKYFEGSNAGSTKVPAIVGILLCDLLLILSAMIPKRTIDQFKKSEEKRGRQPHIALVTTSLYAWFSCVVNLVVLSIMDGHWDSIEEMNEVRNVAKMHMVFTMLFLALVTICQRLIPDLKNIIFTRASEESKAKIETGEKADIENPPPTYSEVLEITIENPPPNYSEASQITIKDIENCPTEVLEILEVLEIENPPPKYSEPPQN